jgi:hypothetical protein
MDKNAVNAMIAHQMRSGDDNTFVRSIVQGYTFATYGKVIKYSEGRVDVQCGSLKFTNVEVLVLGVNGWGIKPVPAVDDRVLLISSQAPVIDIKEFKATGTMPPYDVSGLKAIPVTDEDKALQLITVDKDKVEITGDNKLLINADGIQIEDVNENKVTTSDSGVEFEDLNGNKVTADDSGVAFEDLNGNKVTTDDSGVAFEDLNGNKVTCDDKGVAFEDTNGNKITTASAGITVEDKNGCKIVTSSSSVKINDKLEIKK